MAQISSYSDVMRNLYAKAYVDLRSRKAKDIIPRLSKMLEAAMTEKNKMNFGGAYVYFKRWMLCVEWLQKQDLNNDIVQKNFSNKQIKTVRELLIETSLRIQKDYEAKQKLLTPALNKSTSSKINDGDIVFPETPSDEPQPKEKGEVNNKSNLDQITCTDLLAILNKNTKVSSKKVLIIDTRTSDDYNKLRMSFVDSLINIPEKILDPSKSVSLNYCLLLSNKNLIDQINEKVSNLTEFIVLLDSNSSAETIDVNSPLVMLKNCLEQKFELKSKYSRTVILKGGFEEWVATYPAYIHKSTEEDSPVILNDVSNDALDNIKYTPQNSYDTSPILSGRHKQTVNAKPLPITNSQILDTPNSISNNSSYFPSNENFKMSSILSDTRQPQVTIEPLPLTDSQIMMLNNRNSSLPYNNINGTSMNGIYYPYENGTNNKQMLLNNMKEPVLILEKVDSPPMKTVKKPFVDRSSKPGNKKPNDQDIAVLEKDLKLVRENIASMRSNPNNITLDVWVREQYECLLKKEQELIAKLETLKKPQTALAKSTSLYPDLSVNLSNISLESNKKTVSRPLKPSLSDEKENIPKPQENVDRISLEPTAPQDMNVDEEEIYKAPLKRECNTPVNSRMKRSYSSPNLVQVKKLKENHQDMEKEDRKIIPEIDRSSKPRLESAKGTKQYFAIAPKDRQLHLNPVASSAHHPGITGLKNLGNSCYMNSIIQCLSNTEFLANYFNDNTYTHDLKYEKNLTCVAEEVAHVIKALWRGTYKSISPFDLKVVVGHYKLQFKNHEQQDSHEFLTFLLEWMHNDLKKKSKVTYNRPMTTIEVEWEKSMNGQSSMISKLFFGLLRSTVQCLYCKKNSTTYETFNSLTMSLPVSNKCTLDECVRKFVSGQKVSGWNCPNCKVPRDGEKKFDIAKLPHIIVIHLNRFGDSGGWLEKKNTAVDFPLAKFDLRPYLVSDEDTINNAQSSCYNLYAISNHYGTMDRGHYTAFCKSSAQNKWYKYDDHTVTEVPQSQVKSQSSSAYLLFYTSISNDILKE